MKPSLLFIIASDPRSSSRPAEAIRIAAGIGTWKKTDVALYLRDAALLALAEQTDDWVDEDNYSRYLPIIAEFGRPIYIQKQSAFANQLGNTPFHFEEIDDSHLAALAAKQTYVARF